MKKTKQSPLTNLALAAIDDVKGLDVRVIDVRPQTPMTDDMVICTGTSNRHVRAIAENVIKQAKEQGHRPRGIEGLPSSEWVLVDLGDVLVHVMQAQARAFYQLEKLWDVPPPRAEAEAKAPRPKARSKAKKAVARKRPAGKKPARKRR